MGFVSKVWRNYASGRTRVDADALNDLEGRIRDGFDSDLQALVFTDLSADYTLNHADGGTVIGVEGAKVVTVPAFSAVAFEVGTPIEIVQLGSGAATVHPATGVTIWNHVQPAGTADRVTNGQFTSVRLLKMFDPDVWLLSGDMA